MGIVIVSTRITRSALLALAPAVPFKTVKVVVDVARHVMAAGGDLHMEMRDLLVKEGSAPRDLWGVRVHGEDTLEASLEFVSQINDRPSDGNSSLRIHDVFLCGSIRRVMEQLIDWSS
jgi:hypothetical protein